MAATIEALVNQALVEIGYPGRVADIYEDGPAARAAIEVYGQTRDEIFDLGEWPLARRANIGLALLKGPPPAGGYNPAQPWSAIYPPPGFLYEYLYPDDCIELNAIVPPPSIMFLLDPKPAVWRVDNDNSLVDNAGVATTQKKVILTNVAGALAVYTGRVIDPALWEAGFTQQVVERMAKKLARVLMHSEGIEQRLTAEEAAYLPQAAQDRG